MGIFSSKPATPSPAIALPLRFQESFGFPGDQRDRVTPAIFAMVEKNAPYVGTIILNDGSRGTACLLENNTMMTCLHVVLDYAALIRSKGASPKLIDFTVPNGIVIFAKDSRLYQYNIIGVKKSGLENFINSDVSAPASSYDYAVLQLDGNPNADLEGCFTLDPIDHFATAYASDPRHTLAISGPEIRVNDGGNIEINHFCSIAENLAAGGGNYHYQQIGNHYAVPGLSGQAILPMDPTQGYPFGNSVLYAIHAYFDPRTESRIGVKISDSLRFHQVRHDGYRGETVYLRFWNILNSSITPEVLRSVVRVHAHGSGYVEPGAIINEQRAISLLRRGESIVADTKSEAKNIGELAFGKLTKAEDHRESSAPCGLPHFHDARRAYKSHVFFKRAR